MRLQEENKKLKQKQKDKMQPKMGKLDIDYQVLHDAFFKHQNKPSFSIMGDLYYEGKEFEARVRPQHPGSLCVQQERQTHSACSRVAIHTCIVTLVPQICIAWSPG